ncbi:hypothetical protein HMPREF1981_02944 [Bacteroides pyogenes F0041]|uniref:Uncharacterized protein n=1 Tax=Bacteroides pyogenes F0041 TaxID=1321819 RepID=U2CCM5_9BACE|nr:hypothetical protein HMPREF1981_02944 [Bacteroides pyogenes F0041]
MSLIIEKSLCFFPFIIEKVSFLQVLFNHNVFVFRSLLLLWTYFLLLLAYIMCFFLFYLCIVVNRQN